MPALRTQRNITSPHPPLSVWWAVQGRLTKAFWGLFCAEGGTLLSLIVLLLVLEGLSLNAEEFDNAPRHKAARSGLVAVGVVVVTDEWGACLETRS